MSDNTQQQQKLCNRLNGTSHGGKRELQTSPTMLCLHPCEVTSIAWSAP